MTESGKTAFWIIVAISVFYIFFSCESYKYHELKKHYPSMSFIDYCLLSKYYKIPEGK